MKRFLLLALLAAGGLSLGGCAVSPEDKEFYYGHWVKPTEMDSERQTHIPRQQSNPGDNALPVTDVNPATGRGSEWNTPERY